MKEEYLGVYTNKEQIYDIGKGNYWEVMRDGDFYFAILFSKLCSSGETYFGLSEDKFTYFFEKNGREN